MYLVYDRLSVKVKVGNVDVVRNEILRYIQVKAEVLIEDTMLWLNVVLKNIKNDVKNDSVGYDNINMLTKLSESLLKVSDLLAGYITAQKVSNYKDLINIAGEYLAVEDAGNMLEEEMSRLLLSWKDEDVEMLKKCVKPIWVGFDKDDEYGSIVCEVSEE
ncbi:MAG: hypothetical protein QXZ48_09160 [Zestosphaera sp.]